MKLAHTPFAVALATSALLVLGAGQASATTFSTRGEIDLDDEAVIVTNEDGEEARISPDGDLEIEGRRVKVSEQQRRALTRYNETVHEIVDRAVVIGLQGVGVAFSALGTALAAIASGEPERAEERVEAKAQNIKASARRLCLEVRHLQRIQDALADDLPAFRDFAVIDEDDAEECRVED